jgi:hypothetical protein
MCAHNLLISGYADTTAFCDARKQQAYADDLENLRVSNR